MGASALCRREKEGKEGGSGDVWVRCKGVGEERASSQVIESGRSKKRRKEGGRLGEERFAFYFGSSSV